MQLWVCVASPRMCVVIADREKSLSGKVKIRVREGDDPTFRGMIYRCSYLQGISRPQRKHEWALPRNQTFKKQ